MLKYADFIYDSGATPIDNHNSTWEPLFSVRSILKWKRISNGTTFEISFISLLGSTSNLCPFTLAVNIKYQNIEMYFSLKKVLFIVQLADWEIRGNEVNLP